MTTKEFNPEDYGFELGPPDGEEGWFEEYKKGKFELCPNYNVLLMRQEWALWYDHELIYSGVLTYNLFELILLTNELRI